MGLAGYSVLRVYPRLIHADDLVHLTLGVEPQHLVGRVGLPGSGVKGHAGVKVHGAVVDGVLLQVVHLQVRLGEICNRANQGVDEEGVGRAMFLGVAHRLPVRMAFSHESWLGAGRPTRSLHRGSHRPERYRL